MSQRAKEAMTPCWLYLGEREGVDAAQRFLPPGLRLLHLLHLPAPKVKVSVPAASLQVSAPEHAPHILRCAVRRPRLGCREGRVLCLEFRGSQHAASLAGCVLCSGLAWAESKQGQADFGSEVSAGSCCSICGPRTSKRSHAVQTADRLSTHISRPAHQCQHAIQPQTSACDATRNQ